jgi:hypothetical protein
MFAFALWEDIQSYDSIVVTTFLRVIYLSPSPPDDALWRNFTGLRG